MPVISDLGEYVSVTEAARQLDVSPARVRALIDSSVLVAEKFSGRWMVSADSLHARKANQRRGGRPLTARTVWELIDSGFVAQLLIDANKAAQHNIRIQLAERSDVRDVYVLPHFVSKIHSVMPAGRALAESANVPVGRDARWEFDGYVRQESYAELQNSKRLSSAKGRPNVRLRVVDDDIEWHQSRPNRLVAAWLDIADSDDRAADMTLSALQSELRQSGVRPFPVGNDVVSRVSLGVLSALNDELSRGRV